MDKKVRKALLKEFEQWHRQMTETVTGIDDREERHAYCFKLFSRTTFLYFLQTKALLDGDQEYLSHKLEQCQAEGLSFTHFLSWLLMALDTPYHQRPGSFRALLGQIPYLRIFPEVTPLYAENITLPNQFFQDVFQRFGQLIWDLDEREEEDREALTPAIFGYLAETYIALKSPFERKKTGSFYTPEVLCNFLTQSTCYPVIQQRLEELTGRKPCEIPAGGEETSLEHLFDSLDTRDAGLLLFVILPSISILDPANGAANFLVSALHKMSHVYLSILERIERLPNLHHPALSFFQSSSDAGLGRAYHIKKRILSRNIFGVDLQQEPLDVSRMRLYLSLLHEVPVGATLEPLPSLAFSLVRGNSLIGLDRIERVQAYLSAYPHYNSLVATRQQLIECYHAAAGDLLVGNAIYAKIQVCREEAYRCLNAVTLQHLAASPKNKGKKKFTMTLEDLEGFTPFYWPYDFEQIMQHPWWYRCDPREAQVIEVEGKVRGIRFGPDQA